MTSRSALVTGGAGFVGSHLCDTLVARGWAVSVIDDFSRGHRSWLPDGCRVFETDVRDAAGVAEAVAEISPTAVAHLAALHFIPDVDSAPELATAINVDGTAVLLEALRLYPPARLVLASTAAVYPDSARPLAEDVPAEPIDLYGRTKLAAEQLVHEFARETGVSSVVARLFNVVGPRETNPHVIPEIVTQLRNGSSELLLGDTSPRRDFVDVRDVGEALAQLVEHDTAAVATFNVGSGVGTSVSEIVAACARILQRPVEVREDPERLRPVDRRALVADVSAIAGATGWRARFRLEETLAELLAGA